MKIKNCPFCGAAWNTRADGWIPVTERLPEKNAKVLIYTTEDVCLSATYTMYATNGFATAAGFYTNKVTHWMPLPVPPNTGKEN